jgi:RimJ/RimL family protein N-acetyltransferase
MCAIEVTPVVSTERLILRGPVKTDAAAIAFLLNDLNVAGMTSQIPHPYGLDDAETWLSEAGRCDYVETADFIVEHRNFGVVGGLSFMAGRDPVGRPELGYWVGRPYWNRGYATEAVRAAMKWAKRDWRKSVVVAGHFADNPASGQVLCKAGFLYTGDVERRPCRARGRDDMPTRMMVWLA